RCPAQKGGAGVPGNLDGAVWRLRRGTVVRGAGDGGGAAHGSGGLVGEPAGEAPSGLYNEPAGRAVPCGDRRTARRLGEHGEEIRGAGVIALPGSERDRLKRDRGRRSAFFA